ncbi:hypothetical protein [Croceicoccus naphthovorans]|uniref:Uncharacterized protein n=1 Tax=Croceicoccus naphthovorans TaxID=1348774 RepID=A0A0G3XFE3_9SPHN|nr:hypothetical protein [Croceicoccus naphthovorans]AKM09366.1 hypothetical protein AB433_04200 [Croceicoccus naphthovorans]MBB3990285.1 hypothetical protein [Croceicoccus naphthovorans]
MNLYVTPKGRYVGTQAEAAKATRAEGSKAGSWKAITVPTDKTNLLAFLNNGWREPGPPPTRAASIPKPKKSKGGSRYRAYFKGLFAGVVLASSQTQAEERAAELIEVLPDLSR